LGIADAMPYVGPSPAQGDEFESGHGEVSVVGEGASDAQAVHDREAEGIGEGECLVCEPIDPGEGGVQIGGIGVNQIHPGCADDPPHSLGRRLPMAAVQRQSMKLSQDMSGRDQSRPCARQALERRCGGRMVGIGSIGDGVPRRSVDEDRRHRLRAASAPPIGASAEPAHFAS